MARFDFSSIFKRSTAMNTNNPGTGDYPRLLRNIKIDIKSSSKSGCLSIPANATLMAYTEAMCNKNLASEHCFDALELLESMYDSNLDKRDINNFKAQYTNRILPYVEDIGRVVESVESYNLPEDMIEDIKETASNYLLADKILNNHKQISKRFNIENEVSRIKYKGLSSVVETCCSMIDTYNLKTYQKFSMCIDEMTYLFEKNHIDYDQDSLCMNILEYFLLRSHDIDDKELNGFKYTLENNRCIDSVDSTYKFLTESFETTNIRSCIKNFLKSSNKTVDLYEDSFKKAIQNTSIVDIKNNYDKLLEFTYRVYTCDLFLSEYNALREATDEIFQTVFKKCEDESITDNYENITRDDISDMITKTKYVASCIPVNSLTDDDIARKSDYKELLSNTCLENCYSLYTMLYDKKNLKALDFVNEDSEETVPLDEFKIFKFNNLIKATKNLNAYLAKYTSKATKGLMDKIQKSKTKVRNILFDENGSINRDSIYNFIGEDSKVDFCLYQIETTSENETMQIQDALIDICDNFNYQLKLEALDNIRAYYILNGTVAELHLKDATKLSLSEADWNIVNTSDNDSSDIYIEQLGIFDACNSIVENINLRSLDETISGVFMEDNIDMSIEQYDVAMDALALMGANKYQAESFTSGFSYYRNSILNESADISRENLLIKKIHHNWQPETDIPYDIQIEAAEIFYDIISEAVPKLKKPKVGGDAVKTNKPDNKEAEASKESGADKVAKSLNNIKLYLHGLRGKAKQFSQKEKELSRNLDANFNNFAKGVKNALVSDRRESVIKGSVIPSFSRSIKIAMALAGMGIVTSNPVVPLVAALGGLAASKKLTKRERLLLLDEIETELEVLDKEIANADAKNQIKKYRQLLQYKKDLQRQYQRIKYNVRVGKDILPGSAAGFKER